MKKWIVQQGDSGKKLVTYLQEKLGKEYSARQVKRFIESNLCRVNDRTERFASFVIRTGYTIQFDLNKISSLQNSSPEAEDIRILFEDEHLLIYNKPAGVSCDEQGILAQLSVMRTGLILVHRLDRETTGVLIFSKTKAAYDLMVACFENQMIQKTYWAIVDGIPNKQTGTIHNMLAKVFDKEGMVLWGEVQEHGLTAITEWSCKKKGKEAALIVCSPKTGRTHQLRVHMKGMGHPILGDYRYCSRFKCSYRPLRTMLHARAVTFTHPFTHLSIRVEAPLPQDFIEAAKAVGVGA